MKILYAIETPEMQKHQALMEKELERLRSSYRKTLLDTPDKVANQKTVTNEA